MTIEDAREWPALFVKTATGSINFWQIWTTGAAVHTRWGQMGTDSPQTDGYMAEAKNVGRKNETQPHEQAQKEAQAKFDKQLRLKYKHTAEEAETNLNIKPMRAYTLDDKRQVKLKGPVHVQPKLNGVRCMAYNLPDGTVRLMSRGGKDYTLPHVQNELQGRIPAGWCLDGELYVHGTSLQTIRHYIETPCEETLLVKFTCYDFPELPTVGRTWHDRYFALVDWFEKNHDLEFCELCETQSAVNMIAIEVAHSMFVERGYEGIMVRILDGPYRLGAKSTHLLKYKKFQDDEFEVTGWDVGKDGVIKYACVQEEGLTFEVRPMGNEFERQQLLAEADASIGRLLTVRFQERSDNNIPIFPVGVALRPAKDLD